MICNRITEVAWFAIISVALVLAFLALRGNQKEKFAGVDACYAEKTAVNLSADFDSQTLANLLVEGNYVSDNTSAMFIAEHIKTRLAEGQPLPNLGELNKRSFRISAAQIDEKGGSYLKTRLEESRLRLGITDELPTAAENILNVQQGDCEITVEVQEFDPTANFILRKLNKNLKAVPNVLVQLKEHYYDSLSVAQEVVLGYATANEKGIAVFQGLNPDGYYSVLPIQKGYEYGNSKGTTKGNLAKSEKKYTFTQREHALTPFDVYTYTNIKEDNALTVRTPQDFQSSLTSNLIFILMTWWLLHLYLVWRKKKTDQFILPCIMALSGICLLTMYSIYNPLADKLLGGDMAQGILVGIVLIGILSEVNFVTFFNSNYKFLGKFGGLRPVHFDIVHKIVPRLPQGSGYLILALLLTVLLFPFGDSPQAGVKVNLFFFQPSEIAKYLIVIFLAVFFYNNAKSIQTFSQISSKDAFKIQRNTVWKVIASLVVLLLMYLDLKDMGPALVIAGTFILIYSFVRQDFPQLLFGMATFVVLLLVSKWLIPDSQLLMFAFMVLWLMLWLVYGFKMFKKPQLFESAIFLNLVIAVFIFGSNLPKVGDRLQDRNDIYAGIWDNEVRGGDQVAQGLWALASGGISGQGLGEGNPNVVPACHTDMIFTSIGEQMGFIGLAVIIGCLAILLWRSLLAGKKSGHPFTLYLVVGIVIITGVQFLIITLGCVGVVPLTGVAVPFLSYGKVSMIMNFVAFAIVFSISNLRAGEYQKAAMDKKELKLMMQTCQFGYAAFAVVLFGTLCWYMFLARNSTLIRPALMVNTEGARIVEYNPRIRLLMREMDAGNIYDRNGILLATNDKTQINNNIDKYIEAGVAEDIYKKELKTRKQRYYPFGENLFFWLGDFNNTNILWNDSENDPRGYVAERRHLAHLRGFDNLKRDEKGKVKQFIFPKKYQAPFLNQTVMKRIKKGKNGNDKIEDDVYKYTDYDYSFLIPFLKAGINSSKLKRFNEEERREKNRDIMLTVDAILQTKMQGAIAAYAADNFKGSNWNKLRISVVVLDAKAGDVLCSANYPLPVLQTLKEKQNRGYSENNLFEKAYTDRDLGLTYQTPPGSTAKVMSALAGLQKLGTAAANKTYYIDAREVVETGIEPSNDNITMHDAIVKSSNNYFINLVNDQKLYSNLDSIYQAVGIRIDKTVTKSALTPYFFTQNMNEERRKEYKQEILSVGNRGIRRYENYKEKRKEDPRFFEKMNWFETAWAWGQGSMSATPLNMARVTGIVANDGMFVQTQFIKKGNKTLKIESNEPIRIVSESSANILRGFMQNESSKHDFPKGMGGKTGTPERELHYVKYNKQGEPIRNSKGKIVINKQKYNDGWYMFFIDSPKENAPLAVAVRMERLGAGISGNAVRLTDKVVLNVLNELGYLTN
jgi:cell division protein FtsW (lipid II flippase)/cell division protein FtsI/penicillin-binding protein 2